MKSKCFTKSKTYIKHYEAIEEQPQQGDWIIAKNAFEDVDIVNDFLNNNIGYVIRKTYSGDDNYVKYFNIPEEIERYFKDGEMNNTMFISKREILAFSHNKEELKTKLTANKYNL